MTIRKNKSQWEWMRPNRSVGDSGYYSTLHLADVGNPDVYAEGTENESVRYPKLGEISVEGNNLRGAAYNRGAQRNYDWPDRVENGDEPYLARSEEYPHEQEDQYRLFKPGPSLPAPSTAVTYMSGTKAVRAKMMEGLAIVQRDAAISGFGPLVPSHDLSPHSQRLSRAAAERGLTQMPAHHDSNEMTFEDPNSDYGPYGQYGERTRSNAAPVPEEERLAARSSLSTQLRQARLAKRGAAQDAGTQGTLF